MMRQSVSLQHQVQFSSLISRVGVSVLHLELMNKLIGSTKANTKNASSSTDSSVQQPMYSLAAAQTSSSTFSQAFAAIEDTPQIFTSSLYLGGITKTTGTGPTTSLGTRTRKSRQTSTTTTTTITISITSSILIFQTRSSRVFATAISAVCIDPTTRQWRIKLHSQCTIFV